MDNLSVSNLKTGVNAYFNLITKIGIILVILSTLLLFTNITTEFFDTPKFLVLLAVTGILLVLISLKFTLNNKVIFTRTPLDIPLLLLLVVGIVSTAVSPAPFAALLGHQVKVHGSLVALVVYILFYFVLVNVIKSVKEVKRILFIIIIIAAALSVVTLLAFSGFKLLPAPWTHGINFTPTGSSFSTTAVLALLIPITIFQILTASNLAFIILNSIFLILFGTTIALTGSLPTWIAAVLGTSLIVLISPVRNIRSLKNLSGLKIINLAGLIIPVAIIIIVTVLSLIPPLKGANNPLYKQSKSFPQELQLAFIPSWKIAVSAFRDSPFWGTSPASFIFDFGNYKTIEYNSSKNWNLRFDNAFNEYLQVLATLGGVGLVALLSLTALFISSTYQSLELRSANQDLRTPLAISGLIFFILLALHSSTLVLWVIGLIILAVFIVLQNAYRTNTEVSSNNIPGRILRLSGEETLRIEALPSIILTIFLGLMLFTFFFTGKYALADYHHRLALNALSQNQGVTAYNELVIAEKLNPISDLYRIDLAQTNFALANAIALAKAPTEASPTGSLTDQDKQNIQVLLQQSITEGRNATALSPRSATNWEILGLLYRQIAGVAQNALVFSLDSYGKAIFQDPLNPNLRLSVGGVYYAIQNYDLAIRFFTDAINLKPDFANGYYNLSVALRDKGDLVNAQASAEKVLTLVEKDSQDYKVANDYLSDLKNRIASGSAKESQIQPPAAKVSGELQNKELPKVVNVGNPPTKIATPSAVKKPNSTPEPTATP